MGTPVVFISEPINPLGLEILAPHCHCVAPWLDDNVAGEIPEDAEAIMVRNYSVTAERMDAASRHRQTWRRDRQHRRRQCHGAAHPGTMDARGQCRCRRPTRTGPDVRSREPTRECRRGATRWPVPRATGLWQCGIDGPSTRDCRTWKNWPSGRTPCQGGPGNGDSRLRPVRE